MIYPSEIIFVRILVPFILGICSVYIFKLPIPVHIILIISLALLIFLFGINRYYKTIKAYRFKPIIGALFNCFYFFFGSLLYLLNDESLSKTYFARQSYPQLKIWINNEPQQTKGILKFNAEVTTGYRNDKAFKLSGQLSISLKIDTIKPISLHYGDELIIAAKYSAVEPPYNFGEFDFKAWLASKNIYQQAFITQNQVIQLRTQKGNPVIKYALDLRKRQVEIYRKMIKNDEAFAVASTLILGYRADLSDETLAAYSKTGTIHALSVSGMHVGIIYMVLNWLLHFLDRKTSLRITKVILICTLIWFYALITGFSPSVLRSAIMISIYILAKSFNKHTNGYNILAFTAFCLLIYNPFLIGDVGFQLSFLAVLGLIYLHPKIYQWFYVPNRLIDWLWSSVALSLAAQIATLPLSIYYFHQFPMYFIFSNLFILLPVTVLMYIGIAILLLKFGFMGSIFEWLIIFMNNGLKWIADLPFSGISGIWISQTQLLLLSLSLFLCLNALANYQKRALIASLFTFLLFQSFVTINQLTAFRQRKIIFFTLPKNYAAAFINSQTAILLTDLKLGHKSFDFFIKPTLDQIRVKNIHLVSWNTDTSFAYFAKKEHQINFYHYRILLLDHRFKDKKITNTPIFHAVWLHQNPNININNLHQTVVFKSLIIDASNRPYQINQYQAEANKIQLPTYILKKNKAYLIDLNDIAK